MGVDASPAGQTELRRRSSSGGSGSQHKKKNKDGRSKRPKKDKALQTNDGELARRLELPATGWTRRYRVRVFGRPDPARLKALARGVTVEGVHYGPMEAVLERQQASNAWITLALREGKNREVRRVMEHLGFRVNRLIRVAFGPFQLGNIEAGALREVPGKVLADQTGVKPAKGKHRHENRRR